jgi:RNA polymerase sigma-70 factor (ECF subfamily)
VRPAEASPLDDLTLLRRAESGDDQAFDGLVARHERSIFRFARSLVRTEAEAEDVLQETFLAVWRSCRGDTGGTKSGDASVRSWLFSIARHAAYRRGRRRAGEPAQHESLEALGVAAGWGGGDDPEHLAATLESRAALRAALGRLEGDDAALLWLRDVEGLTGPEAAEALGLTLAAQKSRLHRARLKLRAEVRAEEGHHAGRT